MTQGAVDDVVAANTSTDQIVTIDDVPAAVKVLTEAGLAASPGPEAGTVVVDVPPGRAADVTRALAQRGLFLTGLRGREASLESVFLQLTDGEGGL